ncbi:MAG TPA: tetratricopeptide repeat protein [Silvibacterium sp.]|nr:tetratricopeptide repeat protein [Silvibacterium sp.]
MALVFGLGLLNSPGWAQNTTVTAFDDGIPKYELLVKEQAARQDGTVWLELATLYQDAARYQDAERAYSQAVELLKTGDRTTLANAMDGMGTMYAETGKYAKAEPLEREALAMREAWNDSVGVGRSWMHLAMLSLGRRDLADAAKYAEMAADRLVPGRSGRETGNAATPEGVATPEDKMTALIYLSLVRCVQGVCAAAIPDLKAAHSMAQANYGAGDFPVGFTNFLLGYAYWKSGDLRSAAEPMKSGTAGMEEQLGWGHPTYISAMTQYEAFLRQTRRNAEAAEVKAKIARVRGSRRPVEVAHGETILDLIASR